MRILTGVILVIVFLFAGGSYFASSKKREVAEQAALKEKLKTEILTEMKVLNENKNKISSQLPEPNQQKIAEEKEQKAVPLEISQTTVHQDQANVKAMLVNRLHQINANNNLIGSSARDRERSIITNKILDIEIAERSGSPEKANAIRIQRDVRRELQERTDAIRMQREVEELKNEMRAQMYDMESTKRKIDWDMEGQRQQLNQHKRDLENQRIQIESGLNY